MSKMLICTIDTETVGGAAHSKTDRPRIYDLAGQIHTKEGEILYCFNILVLENFLEIQNAAYGKKNFPRYTERIHNGYFTCVATEKEAVEAVRNLCKMLGVKYIAAHNAGYDFFSTGCSALRDDFEYIDIQVAATQTISNQKGYIKFCAENDLTTPRKRCKASAESFYRFLTNDPNFEEVHMAFDDVDIERQILAKCFATHKRFLRNICFHEGGIYAPLIPKEFR